MDCLISFAGDGYAGVKGKAFEPPAHMSREEVAQLVKIGWVKATKAQLNKIPTAKQLEKEAA